MNVVICSNTFTSLSISKYAEEYPENWKDIIKSTKSVNPENFDDGLTQVAPKGQFKALRRKNEK